MTVSTRVFTPRDDAEVVRGNTPLTWMKQLLPRRTIKYGANKIELNDELFGKIAESFEARAFDQVSLQLANDRNEHPDAKDPDKMDPARWRGEVAKVVIRPDGLWGEIKVTPDMDDLLGKNPRLGVSVALDHNYERADGQVFPVAMQHVLATLDPKVHGMAPWEPVQLSNDKDEVGEVVDLSDHTFKEVPPVTKPTGIVEEVDDLTDDDLAAALAILERDDPPPVADDPKLAGRVLALETALANAQFNSAMAEWVSAGVPPAMVELARPVLTLPESNRQMVVLSRTGSEDVDPVAVIRALLDEAKGTVVLGREVGHATGADSATEEEMRIEKGWNF